MEIRMLAEKDIDAWLVVRHRALREHPDAFGRAIEEADTREEWQQRFNLSENGLEGFVLGAFAPELGGVIGCYRLRGLKSRHIAVIWGMYVTPELRRGGTGGALLDAAIARARDWGDVDHLVLDVVRNQTAAKNLYLSRGFVVIGGHPRAFKNGTHYYDEDQMM